MKKIKSVVDIYLDEISHYALLSAEEEKALAVKVQKWVKNQELDDSLVSEEEMEEGERAFHTLVNHNLRLAFSLANDFNSHGVPFEDLIGEANNGLMTAARKFDPESGFRFSSFAQPVILSYLTKAVRKNCRTIEIPSYVYENMHEALKTEEELMLKLGRKPSDKELAKKLGIKELKLQELYTYFLPIKSLDDKPDSNSDNKHTYSDITPDNSVDNPCEKKIKSDRAAILGKIVAETLNDKETFILQARNGFLDHDYTFAELGRKYNCSHEAIRQLEAKALKKLRIKCEESGITPDSRA